MQIKLASAERRPPEESKQDIALISKNICSQYFSRFPLPLLVLNETRQIVFANNASLGLFGFSDVSEFLGQRPGEAMGCAYAHLEPGGCGTSKYCTECGVINAVLKCVEQEESIVADSKILLSGDVECRALDVRIHAAPFDCNRSRFHVVTFLDISDEKRRELMEKVFFHDLLNTAGGMMSLVDMLRAGEDFDLPEMLNLLSVSLHGMVEEIRTQREIRLAENDDYPLMLITLMSLEIVEGVVREMEMNPLADGRVIEILPTSGNHAVKADYSLLRRVLVNMLKNALEATPVGGVVEIGCRDGGTDVVFEVRNAQAMDEAVQLQVFKRFFSTKGKGRGLGTYSIKLLTENYLGGKVEFLSSVETGTVFRVSLAKAAL